MVEGWRGTICHRVELAPDVPAALAKIHEAADAERPFRVVITEALHPREGANSANRSTTTGGPPAEGCI